MAKDLYESRQMYQSPLFFILLIPLGAIAVFFAFDFFFGLYNEKTLKSDTKKIIYTMMESDTVKTYEDYKNYASSHFKELGYNEEELDVSITMRDDDFLIITYKNYFSMFNELFKKGKKKVAIARYSVYFNEYKETVIEEIKLDDEEIEKSKENTINDDYEIIIPVK